jgi:hypothetical protein
MSVVGVIMISLNKIKKGGHKMTNTETTNWTSTTNWELVYEKILLEIVKIVNDFDMDYSKIERIEDLLRSNDFEM